MSKLVQLRQVFGELILSLRRELENLNASDSITLKGPTTVNQGDTVSWEITDHDVFSRYDVEVNLGTASVSGNTITYTHEIGKPVHSPFLMSVRCNGTRRDVFVEMVQICIDPPDIVTPTAVYRDRMQVVWSNGIVNEAALFKSSNVWMMNEINNWYLSTLSRPGDKPNMEMYYQMYLSGSSYDEVKSSFMGGANNELNVYPGAGKPIGVYSYCQYHFGSNARTASADT